MLTNTFCPLEIAAVDCSAADLTQKPGEGEREREREGEGESEREARAWFIPSRAESRVSSIPAVAHRTQPDACATAESELACGGGWTGTRSALRSDK